MSPRVTAVMVGMFTWRTPERATSQVAPAATVPRAAPMILVLLAVFVVVT